MGKIWLPQWSRRNIGQPTGQAYNDERNIKVLWHTWEGTNWDAAESAFAPYPPHVAYKYGEQPRQYVPLDERAYALLSSQSELEFVIQIELAGFAQDTRNWTQDQLTAIGKNVLAPILFFHDVPDTAVPFYDGSDGMGILASPYSRIRFAFANWVTYSGHVGHQHAPAPDSHWDPGHLDVPSIIRAAREVLKPIPQEIIMQCIATDNRDPHNKNTQVFQLRSNGLIYGRNTKANSPWYNLPPVPPEWKTGPCIDVAAVYEPDGACQISCETASGEVVGNGFPPGQSQAAGWVRYGGSK